MEKKDKGKKEKEKIEPNKIYMINKLNFADQVNVLAKICMTLKYAKREPINPDIFMDYITTALAFGRCIIFVTFNEKMELNSCAVVLLKNNPVKGKIFWLEWCWSDGKDLELGKKVFEKIENIAQRLGAKRIAAAMERGIEAVYKKYGLEKEYVVVSKEVRTNVEND